MPNEGGPCCTHQKVIYNPEEHEGGTVSDRWTCLLCGEEFVPRARYDAEVGRLTARMQVQDKLMAEVRELAKQIHLTARPGQEPLPPDDPFPGCPSDCETCEPAPGSSPLVEIPGSFLWGGTDWKDWTGYEDTVDIKFYGLTVPAGRFVMRVYRDGSTHRDRSLWDCAHASWVARGEREVEVFLRGWAAASANDGKSPGTCLGVRISVSQDPKMAAAADRVHRAFARWRERDPEGFRAYLEQEMEKAGLR